MNRKLFLTTFLPGSLAAGLLLEACGNDPKTQTGPELPDSAGQPSPAQKPEPSGAASPDCNDVTGLSEAELAPRQALEYIPVSVEPGKICGNCRFLKQASELNGCPGCQLFKGPVHTKGYCKSWFKMDS